MTGDCFVRMFREGDAGQRDLLGGKGANLAEMTRIGLPVPPGFTITTSACLEYIASGEFPAGLEERIGEALAELEAVTGRKFGGTDNPLLLSVRSGARISMPGMMDTVLNLGLNPRTVQALAAQTGDERFARDCYRRFITMFGNVVLHIPHSRFEELLDRARSREGVTSDASLPPEALAALAEDMKRLVADQAGIPFPDDPADQLRLAIKAVFASWDNQRARIYREAHRIPHDLGTAVNVQAMVFGNMGEESGTGVVFTRDPSTGIRGLYGEYLRNAQGEDVVAGIRTPRPIAELHTELPEAYRQLVQLCELLERHYQDIQDIEFTIQQQRLYLLQTRSAKRTAPAAIRAAHDMAVEGLISRETAIMRIDPDHVASMLHRNIDPAARLEVIARGLPASPGAAAGQVVFDPDEAARLAADGTKVILVRPETTPDDINGILAAQGVLTSRGGMTCHAAIVARGMGKPCIVGCEALRIDLARGSFTADGLRIDAGDVISIDGATGRVIAGEVPMVDPALSGEFETVLGWADEQRTLGVRANADTPEDADRARAFGAEGIGLTRTEHMFMGDDRLPVVQRMIMAESRDERCAALDELLPMQQGDFEGILKAMDGCPVTIRLLDPPLHEFLPNTEELAVEIALLELRRDRGEMIDDRELSSLTEVLRKARTLQEFNPMLGLRGCRLGIVFPEVYEMQCRAIFQAVARLKADGFDPRPELMIPLVGDPSELELLREQALTVAAEVARATGIDVICPIGTMIEIPRACLVAGRIAQAAEFFSFGTNDLTQTVYGYSRDDAEGKFLHLYLERGLLADNPFEVLDRDGVGCLMAQAIAAGRSSRPGLKIGICGEHGGEPRSIALCHELGLDYVSCSPFRVPVARLSAARAAVSASGFDSGHRGE